MQLSHLDYHLVIWLCCTKPTLLAGGGCRPPPPAHQCSEIVTLWPNATLGLIHTGCTMRRAGKLEYFSFDVACEQCEHSHWQQQVPFAGVTHVRPVWIRPQPNPEEICHRNCWNAQWGKAVTVSWIGLMESHLHCHCRGCEPPLAGYPPPKLHVMMWAALWSHVWVGVEDTPPHWLTPPGWFPAGYPPTRDGWLGRSASALTKRTCFSQVLLHQFRKLGKRTFGRHKCEQQSGEHVVPFSVWKSSVSTKRRAFFLQTDTKEKVRSRRTFSSLLMILIFTTRGQSWTCLGDGSCQFRLFLRNFADSD